MHKKYHKFTITRWPFFRRFHHHQINRCLKEPSRRDRMAEPSGLVVWHTCRHNEARGHSDDKPSCRQVFIHKPSPFPFWRKYLYQIMQIICRTFAKYASLLVESLCACLRSFIIEGTTVLASGLFVVYLLPLL